MQETDEVAQEKTRSINLECTILGDDKDGDTIGNVVRVELPLDHQDVAETKFETFIGELAEVLGEYFESGEQEPKNTVYPH